MLFRPNTCVLFVFSNILKGRGMHGFNRLAFALTVSLASSGAFAKQDIEKTVNLHFQYASLYKRSAGKVIFTSVCSLSTGDTVMYPLCNFMNRCASVKANPVPR